MICWDWSHHLCSCYLDAFQFIWLLWWDSPCIWFLWKGVWYLVTWWCGQDWSCVQLLVICQAGPNWYVSHVLLSADGRTVRSARYTPCRIHRESCIFLVMLTLEGPWSVGCSWIFSWVVDWLPLPTFPSNPSYTRGIYTLFIMSLTFFIHLPLKMEPIRRSETSAIKTQTSGNYSKRNIIQLKHGESLKTLLTVSMSQCRTIWFQIQNIIHFLFRILMNQEVRLLFTVRHRARNLAVHVTLFFNTPHNYKWQAPVKMT